MCEAMHWKIYTYIHMYLCVYSVYVHVCSIVYDIAAIMAIHNFMFAAFRDILVSLGQPIHVYIHTRISYTYDAIACFCCFVHDIL